MNRVRLRRPECSDVTALGFVFPQTKDALFTILHDLRPQDRFSIVGFSNRIKVWKDHLVSVTPDNIRDGKVYIHHMSPTGGKREPGHVSGHVSARAIASRRPMLRQETGSEC